MTTTIRQSAALGGSCVVLVMLFTVIASYVALYLNHSTEFFEFPYAQWWVYLFEYWGTWFFSAWTKLLTAACFGLMPIVLIIKLVGRRAGFFTEREGRSGRGI